MNDDDDLDACPAESTWPAMRETTLADLEVRLSELDEHTSNHDILMWLDRATSFQAAVKAMRNAVFEIAVAWIRANGDLQVNDEIRYTIGHQRTVRCLDVCATLHAALTAMEGDVDAVASLLSANGFKHGACRTTLSRDDFEKLFVTEVRSKLVPGASQPPKRLIRIDERYSRPA